MTPPDSNSLTIHEQAANAETWQHIHLVQKLLAGAQMELMRRQFTHDQSKLVAPEVATFTQYAGRLKRSTYGSEGYKANLEAMSPALKHHYSHNRHHPEHYKNGEEAQRHQVAIREVDAHSALMGYCLKKGLEAQPGDSYIFLNMTRYLSKQKDELLAPINGMTLFDLIEMLCDWVAAGQRHDDGDIKKSLEINQERFNISPQLQQILENTVPWISDEFAHLKTQKDLSPQASAPHLSSRTPVTEGVWEME